MTIKYGLGLKAVLQQQYYIVDNETWKLTGHMKD